MANYYRINRQKLADELAEKPTDQPELWEAAWDRGISGAVGGTDHFLPTALGRELATAEHIRTVLVDGRYGTGKSSFAGRLCWEFLKCLRHDPDTPPQNGAPPGEDDPQGSPAAAEEGASDAQSPQSTTPGGGHPPKGDQTPRFEPTLWLHMPTVTNAVGSTALAAVVAAITSHLMNQEAALKALFEGTEGGCVEEQLQKLQEAMRDFWRLEARLGQDNGAVVGPAGGSDPLAPAEDGTSVVPPRPNRMASSASGVALRTNQANTIELRIDHILGWRRSNCDPDAARKGPEKKQRLLVVLDDLDRCGKRVPMDVIRLLLRFGNCKGVHFVIACDRDILEHGVREWMACEGRDGELGPIVTANSAIEKYLHHIIEMPELGDKAPRPFPETDREAMKGLATRIGIHQFKDESAGYILADVWLNQMIAKAISDAGDSEQEGSEEPRLMDTTGPAGWAGDISDTAEPEGAVVFGGNGSNISSDEGSNTEFLNKTERVYQKKAEQVTNVAASDTDSLPAPRYFEQALEEICEVSEKGVWRFKAEWRLLFGCLTIRQLKAYLRRRLLGAAGSGGDDIFPHQLLLRAQFHQYSKLKEEDFGAFQFVARAAQAALTNPDREGSAPGGSGKGRGLASGAARRFIAQVEAIVRDSPVFSGGSPRELFPQNEWERLLLLVLLEKELTYQQTTATDGDSGRRSSVIPEQAAGAGPAQPITEQRPRTTGGGESISKIVAEFADWAAERTGFRPGGLNPAEQVASFQDHVLESHRRGQQGILGVVPEYEERWLDVHRRYVDANTAAAFSNLAVLIDDVPGFEFACARLFRAAMDVGGARHPDINLYYGDFVLDALSDPQRGRRLLGNPDGEEEATRRAEFLDDLATRLSGIEDGNLDPGNVMLRDALLMRVEYARDPGSDTDWKQRLGRFARAHLDRLRIAARAQDGKPASRLDDLIGSFDALWGGEAFIDVLCDVFCDVWDGLLGDGEGVDASGGQWTLTYQIANVMVGRSSANTRHERVGMRMNAALVADIGMIRTEPERPAAIWSQSVTVITARYAATNSPTIQRCCLGLAMSGQYRLTSQVVGRARAVAAKLGISIRDMDDFANQLEGEYREAFDLFRRSPDDPEVIRGVSKLVFADPYSPPIATLEEFLKAREESGWDRKAWDEERKQWAQAESGDPQ